jgi:hypothetical protein
VQLTLYLCSTPLPVQSPLYLCRLARRRGIPGSAAGYLMSVGLPLYSTIFTDHMALFSPINQRYYHQSCSTTSLSPFTYLL